MEENNNSNEPIILGELRKQKSSKPLFVIITFIVLGAILLCLPLISEHLLDENNFLGRWYNTLFVKQEVVERIITTEDTLHSLGSNTSIRFENVVLSNITLNGNTITYHLNTRSGEINLDEDNLYLEVYGSSENLLGKVKLTGMINTEVEEFSFVFSNLRFNPSVTYNGRIQRLEVDYPEITLTGNELTCKNDNDEYIFVFINKELKSMSHTHINNNPTSENYIERLNYFRSLSTQINNLPSSEASAEETDDGFKFTLTLSLAGLSDEIFRGLNNSNYYKEDTHAEKLAYEMNSKGFDCK